MQTVHMHCASSGETTTLTSKSDTGAKCPLPPCSVNAARYEVTIPTSEGDIKTEGNIKTFLPAASAPLAAEW
jgi:hypothetical protein